MLKKVLSIILVITVISSSMAFNFVVNAVVTPRESPYVKPGNITIDGNLDAGKYSTGITMVRADNDWALEGVDPGTTASLYTAWSDGKLYFFFDVRTTKTPLTTTSGATYMSDAIDLYLYYPGTQRQMAVFAATGEVLYNINGSNIGRTVNPGVGYTIELEIPIKTGINIGNIPFAAVVEDNYKKLGTMNYIGEWDNNSTYDILKLAGNNALVSDEFYLFNQESPRYVGIGDQYWEQRLRFINGEMNINSLSMTAWGGYQYLANNISLNDYPVLDFKVKNYTGGGNLIIQILDPTGAVLHFGMQRINANGVYSIDLRTVIPKATITPITSFLVRLLSEGSHACTIEYFKFKKPSQLPTATISSYNIISPAPTLTGIGDQWWEQKITFTNSEMNIDSSTMTAWGGHDFIVNGVDIINNPVLELKIKNYTGTGNLLFNLFDGSGQWLQYGFQRISSNGIYTVDLRTLLSNPALVGMSTSLMARILSEGSHSCTIEYIKFVKPLISTAFASYKTSTDKYISNVTLNSTVSCFKSGMVQLTGNGTWGGYFKSIAAFDPDVYKTIELDIASITGAGSFQVKITSLNGSVADDVAIENSVAGKYSFDMSTLSTAKKDAIRANGISFGIYVLGNPVIKIRSLKIFNPTNSSMLESMPMQVIYNWSSEGETPPTVAFTGSVKLGTGSVVIKDKTGGATTDSSIVTTGTTVDVTNGATTDAYKIIIFGDVSGDGNIELTDLADIKLHLLKSTLLTEEYFSAGDISSKGSITISDLLAVKKSILGITTVNQDLYPLKKIS